MRITFDDFNFSTDNDDCIFLSEFQDALETDSWYYDNQYKNADIDGDYCMTIEEWEPFALQFYADDNILYSRADFFDRVYGGNCDYWTSTQAEE